MGRSSILVSCQSSTIQFSQPSFVRSIHARRYVYHLTCSPSIFSAKGNYLDILGVSLARATRKIIVHMDAASVSQHSILYCTQTNS